MGAAADNPVAFRNLRGTDVVPGGEHRDNRDQVVPGGGLPCTLSGVAFLPWADVAGGGRGLDAGLGLGLVGDSLGNVIRTRAWELPMGRRCSCLLCLLVWGHGIRRILLRG